MCRGGPHLVVDPLLALLTGLVLPRLLAASVWRSLRLLLLAALIQPRLLAARVWPRLLLAALECALSLRLVTPLALALTGILPWTWGLAGE